jgi:hypothetical protein
VEAEQGSKPQVTRQQFSDFLLTEKNRVEHCSTLPFTGALWIIFFILTWSHGHVKSMGRMRQCLHEVIDNIQVVQDDSTNAVTTVKNSVDAVMSTNDMWRWISDGLVPALSGTSEHPGFICAFNMVVGGVQLRQELKTLGRCNVAPVLETYFAAPCRELQPATMPLQPMPAATESNNTALGNLDSAFVASGRMPDLSGTDQTRFFGWLDIRRPAEAQRRARQLAEAGWCSESTAVLDVRMLVFNPEVRAFAHASVSFAFDAGGLVKHTISIQPLAASIYAATWQMVVDILWLVLLLVGFFVTLQEVVDRKGQPCCRRCCGDPWLVLDWLSALSGLTCFALFAVFLALIGTFEAQVGEMGAEMPSSNTSFATHRKYESQLNASLEDLQVLVELRAYHRLVMFGYQALLLLRFFRGFVGQPRVALAGRTLASAAADLLHFAVIFAVLLESCILGGFALFGAELEHWSTIEQAHMSTLAMAFGRGDLAEVLEVAPVQATIWLFVFLVSCVYLAFNVVVAIMTHHSAEVLAEQGQAAQSLPHQALTTLRDWKWHVAYSARQLYRGVKARLPARVQAMVPGLRKEMVRDSLPPYADLLEAIALNKTVESSLVSASGDDAAAKDFSWAPVERKLLMAYGCDAATAEHVLQKCVACTAGQTPERLPAARLLYELQTVMHGSYEQLDAMGDEIHAWLQDRRVDARQLEPRQRKLETTSRLIEPNQAAVAGFREEFLPVLENQQQNLPLQDQEERERQDLLVSASNLLRETGNQDDDACGAPHLLTRNSQET